MKTQKYNSQIAIYVHIRRIPIFINEQTDEFSSLEFVRKFLSQKTLLKCLCKVISTFQRS